ncbi:MAG: DNA (cytosine-5-)-methyltransferase [Megamonas funiformis]|uniref:DNA (cytosine-5-)-methyltransferase n=1 Tax=Megamonas funiformis TaxID=437897 RepID=UPI003990B35E
MNKENKSNNLDKKWELVNFCEFDKYATKSYCAIHNVAESKNLGDITKVDETDLDDFNMMTWGFPCTDISVAGKQKGFIDEDGEKTRSGMYYEGIRILRKKKPALSIIENVKNLTGKRFKNEFEMVLSDLDNAGYNSYYKVLNAKNYGIPQNRERVFIVSIRKDLDNGEFKFPEPFDNGLRLKDLLEDKVDKKYYLSKDIQDRFKLTDETFTKNIVGTTKPEFRTIGQRDLVYQKDSVMGALVATDYKQPKQILDNDVKTVAIPQATKKGYIECEVGGVADLSYPDSKTRRGRVQNNGNTCPTITATETGICRIEPKERFFKQALETLNENDCNPGDTINAFNKHVDKSGYSPTLTTRPEGFKTAILPVTDDIRIRKLTPKECFRLMGFSDENFDAAQKAGISNSQLYKQAGNSIVVDVLYYIYRELYKAMPYLFDDLKLSSFFSGIGAFERGLDRLYKDINSGNFINPQTE